MSKEISASQPQKKKVSRWVKYLWRSFWVGLLAIVGLFTAANYGVFGKMPTLRDLENPEADLASEIISADGVPMGKFFLENRSEVKYSEISANVVNALIATEDVRFRKHSGIDAEAVARAVSSFGKQGGGSTITQQLAKMILKQGQGSLIERSTQKIKEWIIAVKLERNFTKEELIALYLNRAEWLNIFGIRNASYTYFQKEPADLKVEEAAVLVGMLKGSSFYNPINHPERCLERRNVVLGQMVIAGFLTEADANRLKAKPLITNFKKIDEKIGLAPHFKYALADQLKEWCKKNKNPKTGEPFDLYQDGLRIYTTIDSRMQKYAEEAVEGHMPVLQSKLNYVFRARGDKIWKGHDNTIRKAIEMSDRYKAMKEDGIADDVITKSFSTPVKMKVFTWKNKETHEIDTTMTPLDSIKYQKRIMQTSFCAIDPKSGEIKAWVGSVNYKWFKYDHVTALRQVGSTFKPLVYTLAITDAGYTPETYVQGGAITLGGKTIKGGGGTCAYCLAKSINSCAWRLIGQVGVKRTIEFAHQCGIKVKIPPYYSIALGAAEIPMIEMLQTYTMFPNRGYNTAPVYFTRIEDKNGNLVYEAPVAESKQVIGETDAYTMVKMMQGVIKEGTAKRLNAYRIPAEKAGKTGTTNNNTDGWFIGYTPTLLAGTWVGCEDPFIPIYQNNAGGAEMAAPAWGAFMSKVYNDKRFKMYSDQKQFAVPIELKNDPVLADAQFYKALTNGTPDEDGSGGRRRSADGGEGEGDMQNEYMTDEEFLGNNEAGTDDNNGGMGDVPPVEPTAAPAPATTKPVEPPAKKEASKTNEAPKKDAQKKDAPKTNDKPKSQPAAKPKDDNDGGFGG
jgi:penicillin-binding protein 1A